VIVAVLSLLACGPSAGTGDSSAGPVDTADTADTADTVGTTDSADTADTSTTEDTLAKWEASVGLDLVAIPAGTFTMGSPAEEVGRMIPEGISGSEYDREVPHSVTLTRDYLVGRAEVTRGDFLYWTGEDPSTSTECTDPDCPVDTVRWSQAAYFTNLLSEAAGLAPCYVCDSADGTVACEGPEDPYACAGYRLLTEAEWEYAARAGELASFPGGGNLQSEDDIEDCSPDLLLDNGDSLASLAWYCGSANGRSYPAGSFAPNAWGLLDSTGNMHEWVNDNYDALYYDLPEASGDDPTGPSTGEERVRRGGSFSMEPRRLRLAYRGFHDGDDPSSQIGFRITRTDGNASSD
jgi:formylglycine-generating enzyme required for sulfatase activity